MYINFTDYHYEPYELLYDGYVIQLKVSGAKFCNYTLCRPLPAPYLDAPSSQLSTPLLFFVVVVQI